MASCLRPRAWSLPRIEGSGQVPPKVLKNLLDEAPWIDDSLMAEYFGGIVASSYGTRTRDDRAVALQNTLQSLSTYTLRRRYICHREFYLAFRDHAYWVPIYADLKKGVLLFPWVGFHGRPGRGVQSPPRVRVAMAMSASALW